MGDASTSKRSPELIFWEEVAPMRPDSYERMAKALASVKFWEPMGAMGPQRSYHWLDGEKAGRRGVCVRRKWNEVAAKCREKR